MPVDTYQFKNLDAVVNYNMRRWTVPGMAVGVYQDGKVETHGYGVANLDTGQPVTGDTMFQIGSISKVFTATLVMRLVQEGKLALDTPVGEYIHDLKLADEQAAQQITVRQTLCHVSGIWGDYFDDHGFGDDALGKSLPGFAELKQRHAPGELWTYCNSAFDLTGIAIERTLGTTFEAAMKEKVFTPLGMERTTYFAHEAIVYPHSLGHTQVEPKSDEHQVSRRFQLPRTINPAGGIMSTPEEMLKFAAFHINGGRVGDGQLLREAAVAEMQTPQIKAGGWADEWGLGWDLRTIDGERVIGHGGSTIGFQAYLCVVPARKFAIIMFTNSSRGTVVNREVERWALHHYLGLRSPEPQILDLSDDELARYAGNYSNEWADAVVTVEDGGLKVVVTDHSPFTPEPKEMPPGYLKPLGDHSFLNADEDAAGTRTEFITNPDGSIRFMRSGRLMDRVS